MPDFDDGWWDDPDNVFVDIIEEEPLSLEERENYNAVQGRRTAVLLALVLAVYYLGR